MPAETRQRLPYRGLPRFRPVKGALEPRRQRDFSPPHGYALRWTAEDQTRALDRGYFFERDTDDNHVIVVPVPGRYASDQAALDAVEQDAFHGDAHALKALAFVAQQDRFGWSGVWTPRVIESFGQLRWYRDLKAAERGEGPRYERVYRSDTGRHYFRRVPDHRPKRS